MLGHVDGQGKILSFRKLDNSIEVAITLDKALMRYIVEKGSVAIDGISLTVAERTDTGFTISLIPHTGEKTILMDKKLGDPVNIECDYIGNLTVLKKSLKKSVQDTLSSCRIRSPEKMKAIIFAPQNLLLRKM